VRDLFARVAAAAVERPAAVIAACVLLTLLGAVGALGLEASRDPDTLVDRNSEAYGATQDFHEKFGDEPVRILVRGDLSELVLTNNLGKLLSLEGCLSGNVPEGRVFGEREPAPGPCAEIARSKPSKVVYGPATFINQTAIRAEELLAQQSEGALQDARAAARAAAVQTTKEGGDEAQAQAAATAAYEEVLRGFQDQLFQLATRYGLSGVPRIDDPAYVSALVFDQRDAKREPKARFGAFFPSADAALISVYLRPDLSEAERTRAIELFREATEDPEFQLRGGSYVVSGVPVIFDGLAQELSSQIFLLLAVALAVMAITLALVFRPPLRLLPLAIALAATGLVFGFLALAGGSLTMASIAVLPVLTGLAVDYAIQFQARFTEFLRSGSRPARAAVEAAGAGGPVIATAALATIAGLLVLFLSPIPMVRGFGLLLVLGIFLAFVLAITAGLATLSMTTKPDDEAGGGGRRARARISSAGTRAGSLISGVARSAAVTGRGRRAAGKRLGGWGQQALAASIGAPNRVLFAALVLAVTGWIAGTRTELISDIRELLPRDLPELEDVDELEAETGVSGDVTVVVSADDLTDPAVVEWMGQYEQRVLEAHGFEPEVVSCRSEGVELCPAGSLAALFAESGEIPEKAQIERILDLLPPYYAQAFVQREEGEEGGTAAIRFGIPVQPFDDQKDLIDDLRAQIDPPGSDSDPPPGVEAEVVGLSVLAADANSSLNSNRYLLVVVGLIAVAIVLLAVYRSPARALVPLVPIVLATGWSSLVLEAAGVPLNPMSATLGALVIAIATEFSVLLAARYHSERAEGLSIGEALRRTYARTGAAVAASGATAIAGFAVLIVSDVRMLRDFGLVTVFDLLVALAGVMLVLPAALVWAENGFAPFPELGRRLRRRGEPVSETS
jgi:hydrophobe/amphiphile efflux-3 (HAE3) family protein